MLSFNEARGRMLADIKHTGKERVPVIAANGRVLAEDLVASSPLPRFDHSAMDGYAVATADLADHGPFTLPVVGESAAGAPAGALAVTSACRIFTGAPLPARADAVIMQENVRRDGNHITFETKPKTGAHVRRAGEDLAKGAVAVERGTRLGPGALALAAMLGRGEVTVARRPIVTIVCTGNELRAPGETLDRGAIPESNSAPLAALAMQAGAEVRVAPIAIDEPQAMVRALEDALASTDLLLTVGGVSVGDHDVVRPALERAGVTLDFWKVAIKPGKPLAVGTSARAHVLGLPGNPASAMVTFALFGMPLLRSMQRDRAPMPMPLSATLAAAHKRSPDRLEFARATLAVEAGVIVARTHGNQASGAATSLAQSDALLMIPPGDAPLEAGSLVTALRWSDL